ncbi:MAG: VIT1/CCC1 transporter family protein [Oscillospiraceae bacterium]
MEEKNISAQAMKMIKAMQQNELTESVIYAAIAKKTKNQHNKDILERLSREEYDHYKIWKEYSQEELKPQGGKVLWFKILAKIFGFTFAIKMMENGEEGAQVNYQTLVSEVPKAEFIKAQEKEHEAALVELLDEEKLKYVGSMVLGLNDALVELTGTLAGLTFALQNTKLIALSGLITGISATLSMASSEFLSAKSEGRSDALKSCTYTGAAYVCTVALLIAPYLLFDDAHFMYALATMLVIVVMIIAGFNYYISVAQDLPFKKRFTEMATISLSVALLSFIIGIFVKKFLGIDI